MHSIIKIRHFWHHRKFVNASDRFSVRCNFLAKIRKLVNASDRLSVRCSFLTKSKTRQCIWLFQNQNAVFLTSLSNPPVHSIIKMQYFWYHRKPVSASDYFIVRCNLSGKSANPPMHPTVSALSAVFLTSPKTRLCIWRRLSIGCSLDKPYQTVKQHLG